jgi:hypothetical protein
MNMEIGTEAVKFPEKKYTNGIFLAVWFLKLELLLILKVLGLLLLRPLALELLLVRLLVLGLLLLRLLALNLLLLRLLMTLELLLLRAPAWH